MKRIIVAPGVTDLNRGDQALVWLIKDILEEGISIDVKLLQCGNNKRDVELQSQQSFGMGYDVMKPLLLHPARCIENNDVSYSFYIKIRWGLTALKDFLYSMLLLSKNKFVNKIGLSKLDSQQIRTYREFESSDLLVVKGGGFLHTYKRLTDIYYLYYSLFNILLAYRMSKKIVIMPNSFGPFLGKMERIIVKKALKKCDLIYARESISIKYLHVFLGIEARFSPDLAFHISPSKKVINCNSLTFSKEKKNVAITMRPYRFPEHHNGEKRYKKYIEEMYLTCKWLLQNGYHPVFVAHTLGPSTHEDDRIALNMVIEKLEQDAMLEKKYSYLDDSSMNFYDMASLYSNFDYIIGTRFHSVIFSMISLIPAITISYSGHKATGIMEDMSLKEYVVDIETIDSNDLISKFIKLLHSEEEVKCRMRRYIESCENYKKELILQVEKILDN